MIALSTCAECEHAELQCPPVIRCKLHEDFRYLDSIACEDLKIVGSEEDDSVKTTKKGE